MPKRLLLLLTLLAPIARGDALSDLRTTLAQLPATTPVHGTFEIVSTSHNSDEDQPFTGKATASFEVANGAMRLIYPKALLDQAAQEARADALDGNKQMPTRSGVNRVRPLFVSEMLDAAGALTTELMTAQLVETKRATYQGKPARLVVLKLSPRLSKGTAKHMKSLDAMLSVWLGDDGVPIAAERTIKMKASILLMSFENDQKQTWAYAHTGDRLIATRADDSQKSDGFGQHNNSTVTATVRLE